MNIDYEQVNQALKEKSPSQIVSWATALPDAKPLLTTNFGPYEANIIHVSTLVKPDIEVLWCDSGYNTAATYRFAHKMKQDFKLHLNVFTPKLSVAYRNINLGGIPPLDDVEAHQAFTEEVKLEPFQRALKEIKPNVWITALRKEQTEHRAGLDIVVAERDGMIKVSPFFFFTEKEMEEYLEKNSLPNEKDYFDPTKVLGKRECGLHLNPNA